MEICEETSPHCGGVDQEHPLTRAEVLERQHILENYHPSKEALEYAEKLRGLYNTYVERRACLEALDLQTPPEKLKQFEAKYANIKAAQQKTTYTESV